MSEQNKQVAQRFIEAFVAGDNTVLQELVVEDFVDHNPLPGEKPGRQGLIDILAGWRSAFPDLEIIIQDNGSKDPRVLSLYEEMRASTPGFRAEVREEPFNFAHQVNRGMKLAAGDHVLLLNNDIEVTEE
jgi:predicted SnoaL-like aldol condensation-catalyzing enzyme